MDLNLSFRTFVDLSWNYFHIFLAYFPLFLPNSSPQLESSFNWTSIEPSTKLVYHKCFDKFECARLEVPLDWNNLTNSNKFTLAVARLPATVNTSDPSFGGTIITNPGGPSGSGTHVLFKTGLWVQKIVDDEKHYEILSFDPRGVPHSSPNAACFEDSLSRQILNFKMSMIGTVDLSAEALNQKWEAMKAFGDLCSREVVSGYKDGSNIRQYVSTALVARDMVALVDKIDEHLREDHVVPHGQPSEAQHVLHEETNPRTHPPLINYWGTSYGTILGNTFASLFPHRIGRMILDSVSDADDYGQSPGWTTNLQDAEATVDLLYKYCFDGRASCPLFRENDAGSSSIKTRVEQFLYKLSENPMAVSYNGTIELITLDTVRRRIFDSAYTPIAHYPELAQNLADLMEGNVTSMIKHLPRIELPEEKAESAEKREQEDEQNDIDTDIDIENKPIPIPRDSGYEYSTEVLSAILCGDSDPMTNTSKAEFIAYMQSLKSTSPLIGGMWSEIKLRCTAWPASLRPSAANRFRGPFTSRASQYDARAAPILFVSNVLDPVTPLRNAHRMAAAHDRSVVLVQDSGGHSPVYNAPSSCMRHAIRRYFDQGELPLPGTLCRGERVPWDGKGDVPEFPLEGASDLPSA